MSAPNVARLLVVDDNPDIHADFRKILAPDLTLEDKVTRVEEALFGDAPAAADGWRFEIDSAHQGAQGLDLLIRARAEERPYAIAFVDVRMPPGWDGVETIRRFWQVDPALQVVICTAFSDYSAADIARELGRTDRLLILKKPFDNIEVIQMATALAEKWKLARQLEPHLANLESLVQERTHKLEHSLSMIRATLDATAEAILVVDVAGRPVMFNETLLRAWGLPLSRMDGCESNDALAPVLRQLNNPDTFLAHIRASLTEIEQEATGQLEFNDGRVFEYYSHPQRMGGKVVGRVWSFRNVSHRTTAEAALRASEYHYRLLFESSPTPIYVFDCEALAFLAVNEAAVKHYGYSRDEFAGLTLRDIALPEDIPAFLERQSHTADNAGAGIWRHRKKDGKLCEMEITSHPLAFSGKQAWLSMAADVTERLNLEAQLRQSQKMESVGQLAGGIAHDFNNLLTVINGHAGLLLAKEELAPRIAEPLKEIFEAAKRAAELTRQLLTFSRKQELQPQVVDLNEVVNNVSKMLRRILGEDIALETDFSPHLPSVKADLGMIEQVLLNLAVNSRDAMPRGGKLRIQTSTEIIEAACAKQQNPEAGPGRYVCLAIMDNGCGIPPENLQRIFEPFFTTKALDRGTGLGLATVYGIVRQHQGWIEVTSKVDAGTTFRLYLPGSDERPGEVSMPAGEQRVIGGTETVLVVEDEAPLLKLIRHILEGHGYRVLECSSGKTALETWGEHRKKIDLVLTDMVLPDGMTGPDLVEIMQQAKPGLKVVFTSGYNAEKLAHLPALKHAASFLQKPFHARKLAETVFDCLNSK